MVSPNQAHPTAWIVQPEPGEHQPRHLQGVQPEVSGKNMKQEISSIQDARDAIGRAIRTNGQYSHNICSCVLRIAADKWGNATANCLIDEFSLTATYGIHKQP